MFTIKELQEIEVLLIKESFKLHKLHKQIETNKIDGEKTLNKRSKLNRITREINFIKELEDKIARIKKNI